MKRCASPVSRQSTTKLRKNDMPASHGPKALPDVLREIETERSPISGRSTDYPAGWHITPHAHTKHQLIYAVRGDTGVTVIE